uniref:Uncharacterized protein n=1 Tax=Anguilla anguilla TaxID=7936 RepID=A0A0E9V771_ANGAN
MCTLHLLILSGLEVFLVIFPTVLCTLVFCSAYHALTSSPFQKGF